MTTPNYQNSRSSQYVYNSRFLSVGHSGNGVPVVDYLGPSMTTFSESLVSSGTVTPGYDSLKRRKARLPVNSYTKSVSNFTSQEGLHQRTMTYGPDNDPQGKVVRLDTFSRISTEAMGSRVTFKDVFPLSDAYQKAHAKLMERITTQKTQLAVTLLELGKTATMIASTATRLAGAYKHLRRGELGSFASSIGIVIPKKRTTIWLRDFTKYKRGSTHESEFKFSKHPRGRFVKQFRQTDTIHVNNHENFLAKSWLEYTYGWMPLLMDVRNSAEACASVMNNEQIPYTSAFGSGKTSQEFKDSFSTPGGNIRYTELETLVTSVRIIVAFRSEFPVSFADAFGLSNPLSVAYELIPFSFVADWFIPIGTVLQSITAFNGLAFMDGSVSTKTHRVLESKSMHGKSLITQTADGLVTETPWPFMLTAKRTSFQLQRQKLDHFPVYGSPRFKSPASFSHALTSIALLQSLFVGKAR